ncbi:MAG TPA: hydroxymethylbilane synthase [Chthoniobacteraceae bacterium]|nr:hydroxymethylbilane synthase [Chthoniobacteraceae bacterium]
MSRPFVLGTRGSALALAQVELVKQALNIAGVVADIQIKKITTSGDRRSDFSAELESGAGVKGLFTKEIETALLDGSIDVAVHSCKDLPGHLAGGLEIAATLERADTADVYIGRTPFCDLDDRSAVGTSSVRRRRQLLWKNPCLVLEEMRGNVPTRIEKLRASDSLSGIVLARAGLDRLRLGLDEWIVEDLPILPAIGQGAIALECRSGDTAAAELLAKINHAATFTCIRAERELLRLLNGDCHLPVGAATKIEDDVLSMEAIIFGEEGEPPRTGKVAGSKNEPEKIAAELFKSISS